MNQLFNLEGKLALVTGCQRGIGRSIAIALAGAGADIIGVSASLPLHNSDVEEQVRSVGRRFYAYQADLGHREKLYNFIKAVKGKHPVPDILVNNAGTIERAPIVEHTDAQWDRVVQINLNAPFILTREFGRDMLERGSGKVIFICSMLSYQGGFTVPGYTASKSGLAGLVKAFANEWASKGVNVNGLAPGYIATDNTAPLQKDAVRNKAILDRIPAARWGEPDDLNGAVIFLSSAASNYMHGSILNMDGGWMGR